MSILAINSPPLAALRKQFAMVKKLLAFMGCANRDTTANTDINTPASKNFNLFIRILYHN